MEGMVPGVNVGRRIATARRQLGLNQTELSERLGVARTTLAEIETGQRRVTAEELYRLANLLRRPLDYFFAADGAGALFAFRLTGKEVEETARGALVHLENRLNDLRRLEQFSGVRVASRLKQYRIDQWRNPTTAGRAVASMERSRLRLGNSPVPDLRAMLERRVKLLAFGDYRPKGDFSGAFASDGERSALLVNPSHIRGRVSFTLAHEYGHALIRGHGVQVELRGVVQNAEEHFANAFAASFLMPLEAIEEAVEYAGIDLAEVSADEVLVLASQFAVSFAAMLARLEHFGIVDRTRGAKLRKATKPVIRLRELGLPDQRQGFSALPATYELMTYMAFHKGSISRSRMSEFLDVDHEEAYRRYLMWASASLNDNASGGGKSSAVA
jgi:Zn-dependent peptidase ImmA (M78 family)/transcriptional regulator with XRE-family HTH domain